MEEEIQPAAKSVVVGAPSPPIPDTGMNAALHDPKGVRISATVEVKETAPADAVAAAPLTIVEKIKAAMGLNKAAAPKPEVVITTEALKDGSDKIAMAGSKKDGGAKEGKIADADAEGKEEGEEGAEEPEGEVLMVDNEGNIRKAKEIRKLGEKRYEVPETAKEKIAGIYDMVVSMVSMAPDPRLIFLGEFLFVLFWLAVWSPFVQNLFFAIVFPIIMFLTALLGLFWRRTEDGIPDLVSLRIPDPLPVELLKRVEDIKQKQAELASISDEITEIQEDILSKIPDEEALRVKLDVIYRTLDTSDNILHEELLMIPENEDVYEEESRENKKKEKKKEKFAKTRALVEPPKDLTSFFQAAFYPEQRQRAKFNDKREKRRSKKSEKKATKETSKRQALLKHSSGSDNEGVPAFEEIRENP